MANKVRNKTNVFTLCLALTFSIITFCETPVVSGQTTVRSSAEQRSRRIAEHQQLRRSALELMQDLRAIHLTPEQRLEIRQLFKRHFTRTAQPDLNNENAAPQAAEPLRTEVTALLTSEQSDKLNSLRQEREERAQKNPDFQIRQKP